MSLLDFFHKNEGEDLKDSTKVVLAKLAEMADPNCNKCYGRGFIGRIPRTKALLRCERCARRYARKKEEEEKAEETK